MTDRELLELAAKAAGVELETPMLGRGKEAVFVSGKLIGFRLEAGGVWNPLTDDGDALRLAVKLRLDVLFSTDVVGVMANTGAEIEPYGLIPYSGDDAKDTRRAIVSAAAEIGRSMP